MQENMKSGNNNAMIIVTKLFHVVNESSVYKR